MTPAPVAGLCFPCSSWLARTLLAATAALVLAAASAAARAAADGILLDATPVALSDSVGLGGRLGDMRFLGGLVLPGLKAEGRRFSQLSALAWDDDEGLLYALSDKGTLFHLRPVFRDGQLSAVRLVQVAPLRAADGKPLKGQLGDAEGMDILHGRNGRRGDAELLVSFERHPRVVRLRPDGRAVRDEPLPAPLTDPAAYDAGNRMLEAVCHDSRLGILVAPEAPLRGERPGYTRIFSLSGQAWFIPRAGEYRISALECLGGGELLVLERDFGRLFGRNATRLRRVRLVPGLATPVPAKTVVELDAAAGHTVDNFEGLARHRGRRFFMVSDDNDLFVQRTLLMYFELLD